MVFVYSILVPVILDLLGTHVKQLLPLLLKKVHLQTPQLMFQIHVRKSFVINFVINCIIIHLLIASILIFLYKCNILKHSLKISYLNHAYEMENRAILKQ